MKELKKVQSWIDTIVSYAIQNENFVVKKESLIGLDIKLIREILETLPCVLRTEETETGILVYARNPIK